MGYETNFEITDGPRNQFLYYQKLVEINEFLNPLCVLMSQLKD